VLFMFLGVAHRRKVIGKIHDVILKTDLSDLR
jgi:predicted amino acid racemase